MIRVIPRYIDHLWYPILVKMAGYHRIVEMQGREVNAWNDMVEIRSCIYFRAHSKVKRTFRS